MMPPFGLASAALVMPEFSGLLLRTDRKSTRLNSSHLGISYAVFCLKKKIAQAQSRSWHTADLSLQSREGRTPIEGRRRGLPWCDESQPTSRTRAHPDAALKRDTCQY